MKERAADVVGKAREPELEVVPEDVSELLSFYNKRIGEGLLVTDEQGKWFLEMEPTLNIVEVTRKDLEYYINLVAKVATGLRGSTPGLLQLSTYSIDELHPSQLLILKKFHR